MAMAAKNAEEFSREYFAKVKDSLDRIDKGKVKEIADALLEAHKNNAHIFMFGNGGSASLASHFAADLAKGTISGCEPSDKSVLRGKRRFKAVCLNDNIPAMTAWANDSGYESVFAEQLENLVGKGDLVIGVSGSGNSPNVLNAIKLANEKGAVTVGITGYEGGKLKSLAKICLVVPSNSMRIIEDIHLILEHMITAYIYEEFKTAFLPRGKS